MPRYFFHLSFGQRLVADEEGVELPNRSAARDEALAVVRELANPEVGGNARRWASWFLQVVDDEGQFFRTPVGYPALEHRAVDGRQSATAGGAFIALSRQRKHPASRSTHPGLSPACGDAINKPCRAIQP